MDWLNILLRGAWTGVVEPKLAKQLCDNLQETFDKVRRGQSLCR